MSIFDKLKTGVPITPGAPATPQKADCGNEKFSFSFLPKNLDEMLSLPEASLDSPFKTAALTVCALCTYAADKTEGTAMLNFLRGPRELSGADISFLDDRFRGGKSYIPFSYFSGSSPENNYTPSQPFCVTVISDNTSNTEPGYAKLFIPCSGADSPRPIKLRKRASDGKWFLWEQYLLTGIKLPKGKDPWA